MAFVMKTSCHDLVATVCLSQQKFSTFVLISAFQCLIFSDFFKECRDVQLLLLLPDEDDENESSVHAHFVSLH